MPRASHPRRPPRGPRLRRLRTLALLTLCILPSLLRAQLAPQPSASTDAPPATGQPQPALTEAKAGMAAQNRLLAGRLHAPALAPPNSPAAARARRFTAGRRTLPSGASAARALAAARAESLALAATRTAQPRTPGTAQPRTTGTAQPRITGTAGLGAPWTPAGPPAIQSISFGNIAGRVTSLALDPADSTGNTLFVGTTGGGVWRSTNAAGPPAQVTFTPLTDDLAVFSPSAGASSTASLSIGALAALPGGVLLAGTGDPNDSADSYYGTGILRSTDSGLTWSLVSTSHDGVAGTHSLFGLGVAAFAYSSATPSLVVAAVSQSAEGLVVNAPDNTSVMGLYYSLDAGASWQMSTLMDGGQVMQAPQPNTGIFGNAATAVVWNPLRQRFIAAVRYHGYYQSPDGITWTRLTAQPGAGLTTSACPVTTVPNSACPIFRGALAVDPRSGDTFALTTDLANHDQGFFRDVCASTGTACATASPAFAQQLPSASLETGNGVSVIAQADYNLALAALPVGTGNAADTLLFVGTADLFRCSVAAGCSLRNTTNTANGCGSPAMVAPAQHALVLGGSIGSPLLFLGNDGGLWRSTDAVNQQATPCSPDDAAHFQNLNANLGSLAEVVSFAEDPQDPTILLAGLGGSGTVSTSGATSTSWQQISAGEGGSVAIDPTNAALWYLSTGSGISIAACANGAACTATDVLAATPIGSSQVSGDLALLDAPWLLDPAMPANLIAATCRVWRGPAATPSLWSSSDALSEPISGPQNAACTTADAFLSAVAAGGPLQAGVATSGSGVLYAGVAGLEAGGGMSTPGHIFATTAANVAGPTAVWNDVTASANVLNGVSNAYHFNTGHFSVSSITVDPHDATGYTVYATIEGFSGNGLSVPHLYRSTDAGAHWTIVSANLPNAPASALVIDPNDANTVYVALDTGVYVTTSIATCAQQNCWSLLGTGLPNAPVTTLAAAAGIPTGDGRLGMLRAGTYGRGLWQIPLLTATTVQRPIMTLIPSALSFSSEPVGSSSAAQAVLVSNTGNAPLLISSIAIASSNAPVGVQGVVTDFALATAPQGDTCTGNTVAAGATCSFAVVFDPSATGARFSTLTLYANVSGGQATLALTGTATAAPAITLSPTSLSFPLTTLAATSAAQNVVLSNTGGATLAVSSVALTGADFQTSFNSCGSSLAPSTSCTISVVFAPQTSGTRTGILTVTDGLGTQTVSLTGTAQTPATDALSASALSFATTQVGATGVAQQLVLTNSGDTPLTLIAASLPSPNFAATNSCGNSLAGHAACSIVVSFVPHTVGPVTATLTIADEFRTQTVQLSGTGVAPAGVSLLPSGTLSFPSTGVTQSSTGETLTLTNNGGLPLVLSSVTVTGDFSLATGSTCAASLAPSSACTLVIAFAPTTTGMRTGSITVVDNAANSPQTVVLTGTGVDFTLAGDGGSMAQTVASGASASFPLLVSSPAGLSGAVTLACTGVPTYAVCNLSAATAPLGGSTVVTATVATGTASAALRAPTRPDAGRPAEWDRAALLVVSAAALLPLGLLVRRRRAALPRLLALGVVGVIGLSLLAGTVGLAGCGSTPRTIPGDGGGSGGGGSVLTPAGTYAVVVTASSGGLSRSVTLSVTVQ